MDYGRLGLVPDPETGRRRVVWALLVVLGHSRHQYAHLSHSQKLGDLIGGLEDAWEFFDGVVQRLVIDNLAAAITRADTYDPVFQRTFEEYARWRGYVIDPTGPRHPTGKPRVERGVSYLRDSFFRGEEWRDLAHARREAVAWCLQTAGTRVHGTTRERPLAVFENVERAPSCRWCVSASIRPGGPSARSIRTITSASTKRSTRRPSGTSAERCGCGPTASSSASTWTGSW